MDPWTAAKARTRGLLAHVKNKSDVWLGAKRPLESPRPKLDNGSFYDHLCRTVFKKNSSIPEPGNIPIKKYVLDQ